MTKQDSIVLVTGAGSGIGQATAVAFAEQGFSVVGCDLSVAGLEKTKEMIGLDRFISIETDVRNEDNIKFAFDYVAQSGLPLYAVAACAGVAKTSSAHEQSQDDWDFIVDINLKGVWLTAKHAMPLFLEHGKGTFVAVGSDASVRGASGYAAYCASKHAVLGLVRCLALDYGSRGIRSNVVCPGFVQTPMMESLLAEAADPVAEMMAYAKEVPLGRFAYPQEVANVILHLASEEASYTNGAVYSLDGGATAGHL